MRAEGGSLAPRLQPRRTVMRTTLMRQLTAVGWRVIARRAALLFAVWVIITQGDRTGLLFGVPVVLAAVGVSVLLPAPPSARWSVVGLGRYALAFLAGSLQGGLDVARRALSPELLLTPTVIRYPLRLRTEPARHLFMGTLNLLPGTLGITLEGDHLRVHVLVDKGETVRLQLARLEARVAAAVGERWEPGHA